MRKAQPPSIRYIAPGLPIVVGLVMNTLAEAGAAQEWWQEIPWIIIALFSGAWLAGAVYADLLNPNSKLRNWIRYKLRFFDVESLVPGHHVNAAVDELQLKLRLKFNRRFSGKILVRPLECIKNGKPTMNRVSWVVANQARYHRGEIIDVILASIPLEPPSKAVPMPVWGKRYDDSAGPIAESSHNKIVLEAQGRFINQKHEVLLRLLDRNNRHSQRIFFTHEDEDLYEAEEG